MLETSFLFLSALFLGVALGVSFSHLMQRPTKAKLTPEAFLQVQQVLISRYGRDLGVVEVGAVLTLAAALVTVWGELLEAVLISVALGCAVATLLVWAVWLRPINKQVNSWTPGTLPESWRQTRARWATFHAIRFCILFLGFSSLLVVLLEF